MTVLNSQDRLAIRSSATRSVLEKTDRILRSDKVDVVIEQNNTPAPAFTDGRTIWINSNYDPLKSSLSKGFSQKSVMITTGLNYHELAHCMFTPRFGTSLMDRVVRMNMQFTANILEDQSAETRFVQLYRPAHRYFTALVSNFMMENEQYLANNYVLVSGRLFLPKKLRELFKDRFNHPEKIDDIDALVAEYKTLRHPTDDEQMFRVIKDLHRLLNDVQHSGQDLYHGELKKGGIDDKATREVLQRQEYTPPEEEEQEDGEEGQEAQEGEQTAEAEDGGDDGEGSSVSEEEADDGEGEGSADLESEDEPAEAEERRPSQDGGSSIGKEDAEKSVGDQSLEDALEEALEDSIEEIEEELDDRIQNIREEERNYKVSFDEQSHHTAVPDSTINSVVVRCQEEFRRVQVQHTPGWNTQQRYGKLNPKQYAKALQGSEYVFKRWREGVHDALDFEIVFLLDQSGSMHSTITTASKSLWALKRTFEELDGTVTVLGFSFQTSLLSQRGDRALQGEIPIYHSGGGTNVAEALDEARRILSVSQKKLKMTVVISDGGFSDHQQAQESVKKMADPVTFIGIRQDVDWWATRRNVVHTQTINEPIELVDVVKNLALRLSEERLNAKGLV